MNPGLSALISQSSLMNLELNTGVSPLITLNHMVRLSGLIEHFIQTTVAEGSDWQITLQNFLLNYRNTPYAATGVAPASMTFNWPVKDKIPVHNQQVPRTPNKFQNVVKIIKQKQRLTLTEETTHVNILLNLVS